MMRVCQWEAHDGGSGNAPPIAEAGSQRRPVS